MKLPNLIHGLISILILGVSVIVTNLLQVLSVILLPFSYRLFQNTNRVLTGFWCRLMVNVLVHLPGVRFEVIGDTLPSTGNALVIANHQTMVDIVMTSGLAMRPNRMRDIKFFAKDIIKWVPGIGWGAYFLGYIFLKRDWMKDQQTIFATFSRLIKHRIPFLLFSYPEGTRLTQAKLLDSQKFAALKGFPKLDRVLLPRPKGFISSLQALRTQVEAVYDVTLDYGAQAPGLAALFGGKVLQVRIHIKRYPIETLPHDEVEVQNWLLERFIEKDRLLKSSTL